MNRVRQVFVASSMAAIGLSISSCSISPGGDKITFGWKPEVIEQRLCGGIIEIEQPLTNGSGYADENYFQLADGRRAYSFEAFMEAEKDRVNAAYAAAGIPARISTRDIEQNAVALVIFDQLVIRGPQIPNFVPSSAKQINNRHFSPPSSYRLQNIENFYAAQEKENLCWAAVLETAFRYNGSPYTQEQFSSTLKSHCKTRLSDSATANQLVFAATTVHFDGRGVWLGKFPQDFSLSYDMGKLASAITGSSIDLNYSQSGQRATAPTGNYFWIDILGVGFQSVENGTATSSEVSWTTTYKDGRQSTSGGMKLLYSAGQLVYALEKKHPVILGIGDRGHTVLLSGADFHPGGDYDGKTYHYTEHSVRLERLYYLDPRLGPEPIRADADQILSKIKFAIEIDP